MNKQFWKKKIPTTDIYVDEEENFKKYYQEDIEFDHQHPRKFDKTIKYLRNIFAAALPVVSLAATTTVLTACQPQINPPPTPVEHKHSLYHHREEAATCEEDGCKEYWECTSCNKLFSDQDASHEVSKDDLTVKAHHNLTTIDSTPATCEEDGNIQFFQCEDCGRMFLDKAATNEIDFDDTLLHATGHTLGEQWDHDASAHWKTCTTCGEQFQRSTHSFKNYVCTECGQESSNKPLSQQEIVDYIVSKIQNNIKNLLGRTTTVKKYYAIDFKTESGENNCYILLNYTNTLHPDELALIRIPMKVNYSNDNIKNGTLEPTSNTAGERIMIFPTESQDDRGPEILKKIGKKSTGYDFVSVNIGGDFVIPGIGGTQAIDLYSITSKEVNHISIDAKNDGEIKDAIEESILNGVEGKTYRINTYGTYTYTFSKNVIYDKDGLIKTAETEKEN